MPPRKRKRDSGAPWIRARGFAKEPSSVGAIDAASDPPTLHQVPEVSMAVIRMIVDNDITITITIIIVIVISLLITTTMRMMIMMLVMSLSWSL